MVVGFAIAAWFGVRAARPPTNGVGGGARPLGPDQFVDFACRVLLAGVVGARLFYVALHWSWFQSQPWEIIALWHGGLVWYGGFLGGLAAAWWYAHRRRLTFLSVAEQAIPSVALAHGIGRIGCFLNGCCYGRPAEGCCGVWLPGHPEPVAPVQLYEAIGLVALFLALRSVQEHRAGQRSGRVLGAYLCGYGGLRFLLEFWRGDQQAIWLGLTLQQLLSAGLTIVGLGLFGRVGLFRRTDRPD
jgi:phosphatidylglycerol:prolipoprotein diacylglycerol transferase